MSRSSARYSSNTEQPATQAEQPPIPAEPPQTEAANPYGAAGPPGQRVQATPVAGKSTRMRAATMAAADAALQIDLATDGSGVRARAAKFEQQQQQQQQAQPPPKAPPPKAALSGGSSGRSVRLQDVEPLDVEGAGTRSVRAASSHSVSSSDSPRKRATTLTSTPL